MSPDDRDLPCPDCGTMRHTVYNSRPIKETRVRWRRCVNGHRFRTTEIADKSSKASDRQVQLDVVVAAVKKLARIMGV